MINNRYIICGIDESAGQVGNDSSTLTSYFELGWEVTTTHFYVKRLLNQGEINRDDIVVTCQGREFLYKNIFPKVINWKDYKKNVSEKQISLVHKTINGEFNHLYDRNGIYKFLNQDKHLIQNFKKINVEGLHKNKLYNIIVFRNRDHCNYRNTSEEYIDKIINISNRYHNTFIVGHGSERFSSAKSITLEEYCSLINEKLCNCICSPQTGPITLARIFSKSKKILNYSVDSGMILTNHHIINGYPEYFINSQITKINAIPNEKLLNEQLC